MRQILQRPGTLGIRSVRYSIMDSFRQVLPAKVHHFNRVNINLFFTASVIMIKRAQTPVARRVHLSLFCLMNDMCNILILINKINVIYL